MADVRLQQITKKFGDHTAVQDVGLHVRSGELLAIVGPSGCGKTTTLRLIAGLEKPTAGTVVIGNRDVTQLAPRHRNAAMVFQHCALYPHMTVRQNLEYALKVRRMESKQRRQRCEAIAQLLQIQRLLDRKPGQLSGGESQRVALGKAIVREPDVFLLDEPLSHLDVLLRNTMRRELVSLQTRLQTTMLYVTHDPTEAMMMGDRIAVMHEGRILQVGTPAELYRQPCNPYVGQLIGVPSMSLLQGVVVGSDQELTIDFQAFRLHLPATCAGSYRPQAGQSICVGVRPEFVSLSQSAVSQHKVAEISACITAVHHLGRETILDLQVGPHQLSACTDTANSHSIGQTRSFRIDLERCHVFAVDVSAECGA